MKAAMFIVTKDAHGNDRVFAGARNFQPKWTLIPDRMERFTDFAFARSIARMFDGARIVNAPEALGPKVRTTGAPNYLHLIP